MPDPNASPDRTLQELQELIAEATQSAPDAPATGAASVADLLALLHSPAEGQDPAPPAGPTIELHTTGDAVNYALVRSGIPVISRVVVHNPTADPLEDLTLAVSLRADTAQQDVAKLAVALPPIPPGKALRLTDPKLELDAGILVQLDEAVAGAYLVTLTRGTEEVARHVTATRILAYNEFFVGAAMKELVAAHVMPNHPAVVGILREAGHLLEQSTGDSSLQGYQSGRDRAVQIATAIYQALRDRSIGYINPPASFERTGQKIRTPDQVMEEGLGTCLDLACTYAACLEQAGLHPLVYFIRGHAYAGFLTEEEIHLTNASVRDHSTSITLQESGLAVPVETVGFTDGTNIPFEDASRHAKGKIDISDEDHAIVDIRRARLEGIHPLPVRVREGGTVTVIVQEAAAAPVPASAPVAPTRIVARSTTVDRTPARMRAWKSALLDLSFRNPLLHLRGGTKALGLLVPTDGLGLLENLLMDGHAIRLWAHDELTALQQARGARTAADIETAARIDLLANQQVMFVETELEALRRRCRSLMNKAREAEEENGTNILHLTLGSLYWTDPKAGKEVRSPILLMPVRIRSAGRGKPMELVADPTGGTASNHCLLHKLRVTFNLDVPQLQQLEADAAGIDVAKALAGLREAIARNGLNMRVDEEATLSLLEFGKFRMWKDLDDHWERFLAHPVIHHLVERAGETFSVGPALPSPEELDTADVFCPIPCDGAQLEAIVAAARGASFVLEGPPGTGKSQTITNLIANALASGRRVLFVAEKRAALNVVKNRLSAVGLAPFCLDIHGKDSSPRQLREQLNASLDAHFAVDEEAWTRQRRDLAASAGRLRAYALALHQRGPLGLSAWEARDTLLRLGDGPEVRLNASTAAPQVEQVAELLRQVPAAVEVCVPLAEHPWRMLSDAGMNDRADRPQLREAILTLQEAVQRVTAGAPAIAKLAEAAHSATHLRALQGIASAIGQLPPAGRQWHAIEALGAPAARQGRRQALEQFRALLERATPIRRAFSDEVFGLDVSAVATELEAASRAFFLFRGKRVREAMIPLASIIRDTRLSPAETVILLRRAATMAREAAQLSADLRTLLSPLLPPDWTPWGPQAGLVAEGAAHTIDLVADSLAEPTFRDAVASWMAAGAPVEDTVSTLQRLASAWEAVEQLLGGAGALAPDPQAHGLLDTIRRWMPGWVGDGATGAFLGLKRWCALQHLLQRVAAAGFSQIATDIKVGTCPPQEAQRAFARGVARAALLERLGQSSLAGFDGLEHGRTVQEFIDLQGKDAAALRTVVPARLLASRPFKHGQRFGEVAELARNELARQKGGLGIRGLLRKYTRAIHELTPCFLMSPDSVAQYLEPGTLEFDLVVFDEASQVPVGDAIGAIARGKSLVVVGDSRQMPPTSFFGGTGKDTEAPEETVIQSATEDLESILSECVASGLPRVWLSWHYRSQDESLIAFSNSHYYDGRLSSFPAPEQKGKRAGVQWRRVEDGVFDRGRTRTNEPEAMAVVAEVGQLLADPATRSLSIGIVTFNIEQQELIAGALEDAAQDNPALEAALKSEDLEHRLFVKNLESVQGDERDIILMSVGFGYDHDGRMTMNFGPLNRPGGERRWNVAVTRARRLVIVFSSIDPEDIDVDRVGAGATGVRHLRAYLELARDGVQSAGAVTGSHASHELHRDDIARALQGAGLSVSTNLGLSSFRVDLALAHPEAPDDHLVAVLLDGPGYAARRTVQDREGLPVGVLQDLMRWPATRRVWLPEWLAEPGRVVAALTALVGELHARHPSPAAAAPVSPPSIPSTPSAPIEVAAGKTAVPAPTPPPASRDAEDQDFRPYQSPCDLGSKEDLEDITGVRRAAVLRAIEEVMAVEAPIEVDRLARLVARRFGLARVRQARVDQIKALIPSHLRHRGPFGEFAWRAGTDPGSWREFRRTPEGAERPLEEVAPEEIRNAMVYFARKGMSISEEGVLEELGTVFDIQRLTVALRGRLLAVLNWAIQQGDLRREGDRLVPGKP